MWTIGGMFLIFVSYSIVIQTHFLVHSYEKSSYEKRVQTSDGLVDGDIAWSRLQAFSLGFGVNLSIFVLVGLFPYL